ncbi:hypothetical protein GcM3_156014 [Golovinomyces cichoracearum]|uniref:Uncharacterized protein n=1 Tax=Golovinomyces cichoracearum TaxID=62708 RepID=A0A420HVI3_9PEZI|nr:hypothetical protein GcM3_156014 [Golovinomyces cichoracearum]
MKPPMVLLIILQIVRKLSMRIQRLKGILSHNYLVTRLSVLFVQSF